MGISFVRDRTGLRHYFFQVIYFDVAFWYRNCSSDMGTFFFFFLLVLKKTPGKKQTQKIICCFLKNYPENNVTDTPHSIPSRPELSWI